MHLAFPGTWRFRAPDDSGYLTIPGDSRFLGPILGAATLNPG